MRAILACCSVLVVLSASGHGTLDNGAPEQRARAPLWISLPRSAMIDDVKITAAGNGVVNVRFDHAANAELLLLKERLALQGYEIHDQLSPLDNFLGATSLSLADDPTTGRALRIYEMQRPAGDAWRVAFADPGVQPAALTQ